MKSQAAVALMLSSILCSACPSTPSPDAGAPSGDTGAPLDTGLPAGDASTAADEAAWRVHAEAVARALCAVDTRCGTALSQPSGGTLASCDERVEAALAAPPSFVDARFDADRARACLDVLEGDSCLDLAVAFARDFLPLECVGVVHGDAPAGATCTDSECGDLRGTCGLDGSCPATCTVLSESGGPCIVSLQCAEGAFCLRDRLCHPLAAVGEPCASALACARGAHCQWTSDDWTVPGICEAGAPAAGEICDPTVGCGSPDLACVATRQGPEVMGARDAVYTCETPRTDGSCRAGSGDCGLGRCRASIFEPPYEGTCEPQPGAGGDCSGAVDPRRCGVGLRCVDGACAAVARAGGSCTADEACTTGSCRDGTCVETVDPAPLCR